MSSALENFKSTMLQVLDKITWTSYDKVTPTELRALARAAEERARDIEEAG